MLVLSRKVGEEIVIGGNIRIVITKLENGRVKIGVDAPKDVKVLRSELPEATSSPKLHAQPTGARSLSAFLPFERNVG